MINVVGIVEKGSGRGKTDFVPTINLMLSDVPTELEYGIYCCSLEVQGTNYYGALHYGPRSSVDNLVTFEVNIFDFSEDIYGKEVTVNVREKVRDIIKFESDAALQAQIMRDIDDIKRLLKLV